MYRISSLGKSTLVIIFVITAQLAISQELKDNEIKRNAVPIQEPLRHITQLNPQKFEYNRDKYGHLQLPGGSHYGFIAEEFQQVFPSLVYRKSHSYMVGKNAYRNAQVKTINLEQLIPVLIASIKEQQMQIDVLRAEIEMLKKK